MTLYDVLFILDTTIFRKFFSVHKSYQLSFYVPAFLGISYLSALFLSFVITDLIIGFHPTILFTWGSVLIRGLISRFWLKSVSKRISGALFGLIYFTLLQILLFG